MKELQAISQKSCSVLKGMGQIQWVQSYARRVPCEQGVTRAIGDRSDCSGVGVDWMELPVAREEIETGIELVKRALACSRVRRIVIIPPGVS